MSGINLNKIREEEHKLIEWAISTFVTEILHGSDEHKKWLKKAGENFILGNPVNQENEYAI